MLLEHESRRSLQPAVLIVLLCLIATIAYVGRSSIGVASTQIASALSLDEKSLGLVMSAFYWSYAFAQVPTGLLSQRWGPRRAIVLFAGLGAICCALLATAVDFRTLVGAQIVFGISQAGLFPAAAQSIALWVPATRRALASGSLGAAMSIGGMIGTTLTGFLVDVGLSWRQIYLLYAPLGIGWSVVFLVLWRPAEPATTGIGDAARNPVARLRTRDLLLHWDMLMICGQQFFRAAGYSFFLTWFPRYLQETRSVDVGKSGYMTSVPLLGVVLGGLLGGMIVDRIDRLTGSRRLSRQGSAIVAMLGSATFILTAMAVAHTWVAVSLIAMGSFFGGLAGACAYTVTIDKAGPYVAPVFGLMNMAGNIGAAVFPQVVPWYLELLDNNWNALLFLFAGVYVVAGVFWCALNPEGELFSSVEKTNDARG